MTLEYLAERVGTTHATLSRLERGIFPYGQEMLERIAQVLTKGDVTALIDRDPKAACKQRGRGYGPRPKG
jgi:transcriptional regulator with XRE-family HTH domain